MSSVLSYIGLVLSDRHWLGHDTAVYKDPFSRPFEWQNQSGPSLSLLFPALRARRKNAVSFVSARAHWQPVSSSRYLVSPLIGLAILSAFPASGLSRYMAFTFLNIDMGAQ